MISSLGGDEAALEEVEKDNLNLSDDFNFDEIDEDLALFQEDEMVQQALHRGVDLKKYGRELEKDLKSAEMESVVQYVENSQQVIDLHKQMQHCDAVLARMQDMLLGFQADLGGISDEIKNLQDESLSMSVRLRNRKAAEEKLHDFLSNSTIPIDFTEKIVSPEVTEEFMKAVLSLNDKLNYVQNKSSETYTGRSLIPDLERLKSKSTAKINEYFTRQFKALRQPKTNVQVLQQTALVKYAPLMHFIQMEAPALGEELRNLYIESMGRTLLSLFRSYSSQLLKLDVVVAGKNDLVAVEEAALKSVFSQKVDLSKRVDTFALLDRDRILDQVTN